MAMDHRTGGPSRENGRAVVLLVLALTMLLTPLSLGAEGISGQTPGAACGFAQGFASLRDGILASRTADPVGACRENEYHALNGDGVQWTSGGLFVWRKATNWTGFTDGQNSWVAGPTGPAMRFNSERFSWENDGRPEPVAFLSAPATSLPPAVEVDEAIRQVYVLHEANGGSTFNLFFGDMGGRKLFAVSLFPDRGIVVPGERAPLEVLRRFVVDNRDLLSDPRISVGTWFNEENGMTYVDLSATLPDRQLAIELGRKYNQISIFDLDSFEEIDTGGTGEKVPNLPPAGARLPKMATAR